LDLAPPVFSLSQGESTPSPGGSRLWNLAPSLNVSSLNTSLN
jgi:hypothetical protein